MNHGKQRLYQRTGWFLKVELINVANTSAQVDSLQTDKSAKLKNIKHRIPGNLVKRVTCLRRNEAEVRDT